MTERVIEYLMKKENAKELEELKKQVTRKNEEEEEPAKEEAKAEIIKIDIEELVNHYFIYNKFISQDKRQPRLLLTYRIKNSLQN